MVGDNAPKPGEITALIDAWTQGDDAAQDRFFRSVYAELRRMAAGMLSGERASVTLQPTALVNEALLKLLGRAPSFANRNHFFGIASRAMRQVLVDRARRNQADKRGAGAILDSLDEALAIPVADSGDLVALDDALRRLEVLDAQAVRVVELRYFAGLSIEETAAVLGIHPSAANREWAHARAWLRRELDG